MYCVLCLMLRLSIQEIKACHASMVQVLSYVKTVDTLRSKHTEQCIVCCISCRDSIQEIKACHTSMVQMLCYVNTVDTKCIYMFLPITFLIRIRNLNPKKVLECWEPGLSNHTTKSYICQYCRYKS